MNGPTEMGIPTQATDASASPPPFRIRLWPAVGIVLLQAAVILIPEMLDPGSFVHFMGMVWGPVVGVVGMGAWWLFASRIPWRDRFVGLLVFIAAITACAFAVDKTMKMGVLFYVLPTVTTGLVVVALVTLKVRWPRQRLILAACVCLLSGVWTTVRSNGMDGDMNSDFAWRWSPTAEDQFLASSDRPQPVGEPQEVDEADSPIELQPGDWPGFRGPNRDSRVDGVTITSNWTAQPPRELWRRRVGPGWSSFSVVGDRAFTQEQHGEDETVVCYHVADGQIRWVNRHRTRFFEAVGGAGPRATPTFHEGRLYTMGAKGAVQCLDAASGRRIWLREAAEDTDAKTPVWGFSSSPLVVGDVVIVFTGGLDGRSVVAYDSESGDIVWTSGQGKMSYASAHYLQMAETEMILMATETGLQAMNPVDGQPIWQHDWADPAMRIVQPQAIGDDSVLFGSGYGSGTRLLKIARDGEAWNATEAWTTKSLKPYFNDFVNHEGCVYGFDGKILTCIDLTTGQRRWKGGRYGYGQLLLLPDADTLLVLSETGEVVLVKAEPDEHIELCKFQAIDGKTWNHPVVAHGRLFVRNGQEAACFELK